MMKKYSLLILITLLATNLFAQEGLGLIVKSNLFNLIAKRPAISVEKSFSPTFSIEASYVWGETSYLPFTSQYAYNGFLLRAKKYVTAVKLNNANLYYGLYAGNLNREIKAAGYTHPTGFISIRDRDFKSNSVRTGGTLGISYQFLGHIVLDASGSLGYGRYFNTKNFSADPPPKGYLDTQIWLSVGYGF